MAISDVAGFTKDRAAGLAVAGTIGFAAERAAGAVPISLSPLLYATAFGIVLGNSLRLVDPTMKRMAPTEIGMAFAKRRLLRAGIILYGAKVTFGAILGIGAAGLLTDLYVVSSTLALGFAGGRLLGLSEGLTTLIATGSSICGCSAVAATQPIINAEAHEVAAAVAEWARDGRLGRWNSRLRRGRRWNLHHRRHWHASHARDHLADRHCRAVHDGLF